MPVICESCPSTSATYSWSSRSASLCLAACRMPLPLQELHQPPQAIVERDRRDDAEAIAQLGIDRVELDVLLRRALMAHRNGDAERARHCLDDGVDADRRARREVDGRARARRF